jgi:hypothetical protein
MRKSARRQRHDAAASERIDPVSGEMIGMIPAAADHNLNP